MEVVKLGKRRGSRELNSRERIKATNRARKGKITISAENHHRSVTQISQVSISTKSLRSSRHIINCDKLDTRRPSRQISGTVLEPEILTNDRQVDLPSITQSRSNMVSVADETNGEIFDEATGRILSHLNLSMVYVNLFKARQKDLKLNSNIDV
jgi:hypothetical protein